MSNVIDRKVVEMQFDNSQFEKNVKGSMSTLEKLKASLNFDGLTKGFDEVEKKTGKIDFSGMRNGLETVSYKFSAFEAIAFGALTRIGEKAVDVGLKFAKSLSIDNVTAGWSKFEDKTRSVGTLIAQGFDMNVVNSQLDRLNWYTDETSYSFTNMVAEIAKFTATGKGLEESVDALMGIANWAALSGQNASTASRAMYQLSQAMGSGLMRKEDYKSIQNVSMDTAEFRQKALDAGVALGTLKKNADGTYTSLIEGAKASDFTISQFADHLTQDAWFTSDVMMSVFRDYGNAIDDIYAYAEKHGITASQAIEELGDDLDEFGLKAFKAAQEARSWNDTVESVKEAVASGFMQTFEIIFGQYDEAVLLWTDLANRLYDVFAEPINGFNEKLEEGLKQSTPYVDKYLSTVLGTDTGIISTIKSLAEANEDFSIMDEQIQARIKGMVHGDEALTKLVTDYVKIHQVVGDSEMAVGANMDVLIQKTAELTGVSEKQIKSLKKLGDQYGYNSDQYKTALKSILGDSSEANQEIISGLLGISKGLDFVKSTDLDIYLKDTYGLATDQINALSELAKEYGVNSKEVDEYIDSLKDLKTAGFGDKKAAKETIKSLLEITNGVSEMSYAWRKGDVIGYISELTGTSEDSIKVLKGLIDNERELKNAELDSEEAIRKNAEALEENNKKIEEYTDTIAGGDEALKEQILTLLRFEDGLNQLSGYQNILVAFNNAWEYIASILEKVKEAFHDVFPPLTAERIYEFTERIKEASEKLVLSEESAEKLKRVFKGFFSIFKIIGQAVKPVIEPIKAFFSELFGDGKAFFDGAASVGDWITNLAESGKVAEVSQKIFSRLAEAVRVVVRTFKDLFNIQEVITKYNEAGGGIRGVLAVIGDKLKTLGEGVVNFIAALTGWDPSNFIKAVKKVFSDIKGFIKRIFRKDDETDSLFGDTSEKLQKIKERLEKVAGVFEKVKEGLKTFFGGVKNFFSKLGQAIIQGDFSKIFEKIANFIRTIWRAVSTVFVKIGEVLGKIFKNIGEKLSNLKTEDVLEFFDRLVKLIGTILGGILGLKGFETIDDFLGLFDGIGDHLKLALDGIGDAFDSFAKRNQVKTVRTLAISLLLLAGALLILASIPTGKMYAATGAIAILMEVLVSAMKQLETVGSAGGLAKNKFNASTLIKVAAAVLIISFAIKQFKDIDTQHIIAGTAAITAVMFALTGVAKVLSNSKLNGSGVKKAATGLVILAIAIRLVVWSIKAVVKLIEKNPNATLQAMIAVGAMIVVLTAVAAILGQVKNPGRVTKAAIGLAALAIALRLVIWSVKAVVKIIDKNPNSALQAMIAVGAMLVVLSGISMLLSTTKHSGRVLGKAIGLIALALALRLIIWSVNAVVKTIDGNPSKALQAMVAVGAILLVLSGISMLLSATKHSGRVLGKAIGLIALALAVRLIIVSVSKMAEMIGANPNSTLQALIAVGAMLVLLVGMAVILSKAGGLSLLGASIAIINMAIALGMLALIVKYMSQMSWGDLVKGLVAFAAIIAILVAAGFALKKVTVYLLAGSVAMVLFGAGIMLLGAGLMLLGLGFDTIAGSITAFAGAFAASSDLIMFAITTILTGIISLIPTLAVALGEGIIAILHVIADNADAVAEVVVALVRAVLISLKGTIPDAVDTVLELVRSVLQSLVDYTPELVDLLFEFVVGLIDGLARNIPDLIQSVVNLVASIIRGLVDAINQLDLGSPEEILEAALKLGEILLILNGYALLVPGALIGVAGIALLALEIVGILALFAEINDSAGTLEYLARGADLLESVGNAIGRFVGAIIGGAAEAISNSLPKIGKNLASFMKNAEPFFDKAGSLDPGVADGVMHLAAAILVLTATDFVNSILDFIGLGVDWGEMGDKFALLGDAIRRFAESTEGINADSFSAVADAMDPLIELATGLPNTEGLWGWISGKEDIGGFGQKLGDLASGMAIFAEKAAAIPADAQQSMMSCAKALGPVVDMANDLPNTEGAWGWISGKEDIGGFGKKLGDLAEGMSIFAEKASEIPADAQKSMSACAVALGPLVDLANDLPNTEGLWGWLSGKEDLGGFGKKLGDLASGMKKFADKASGLTEENINAITAMIPACGSLAEIAQILPNSSGFWGWLSGKQDLGDFAKNLGEFGSGIRKLANKVSDVTAEQVANITTLVEVARSLASMSGWDIDTSKIKKLGTSFSDMGTDLSNMATKIGNTGVGRGITESVNNVQKVLDLCNSIPSSLSMGSFAASVATLNPISDNISSFATLLGNTGKSRGVTEAVNNVKKIADMARTLPYGSSMSNFASGLATLGSMGVSGFISAFNGAHSRVTSAVKSFMNAAKNAANGYKSSFKTAGSNVIQGFIDGMNGKKNTVYTTAYEIGRKAIKGLNDGIKAHSPSKEAEKSGDYFGIGFVEAVKDYAVASFEAGSDVGKSALDGLATAISDSGEAALDGFDNTVTIKPVIDLSEIQNGIDEADGLLGGLNGYTIGGSMKLGQAASDSMGGGSRGVNTDAIDKLTKTVEKLGDKLDRPNQTNNFNFNGLTNNELIREVKKSLTNDIIKEGRKWA